MKIHLSLQLVALSLALGFLGLVLGALALKVITYTSDPVEMRLSLVEAGEKYYLDSDRSMNAQSAWLWSAEELAVAFENNLDSADHTEVMKQLEKIRSTISWTGLGGEDFRRWWRIDATIRNEHIRQAQQLAAFGCSQISAASFNKITGESKQLAEPETVCP